MDKHQPLISIIMPAYNAGPYIHAAVSSVLRQTETRWELIVIDDASTDDTQEQVARFSDSRIHYRRVERIGSPAGVRNAGLSMAGGKYIAFLDADDCYYPDALKTLKEAMEADPYLNAVHGFRTHIDENGRALSTHQRLTQHSGAYGLPVGYENSWHNLLMGYIVCTLPCYLIRRETVERIGQFDEELCGPEDWDFIMRLFLEGHDQIKAIPAYIYQYRMHLGSLSKAPQKLDRLIKSHLIIMSRIFSNPKLPSHLKAYRSKATLEGYYYLAREWLILERPDITRDILFMAIENRNICLQDWFQRAPQLIARTYLPYQVSQHLIQVRQWVRLLLNDLRFSNAPRRWETKASPN